ncbi:Phenylacetic acid catabolic protein [Metabacillus schmidteae]|uniref:Phenylacetic acid catabolic protein n=1 Tax=Metabacillus schmidteae TaxID=2730405 RepID=UPI001589FAF3|nr:Phenylacetic acid catabolic protein [Metabacillus schmidteae]
MAENNYSSLITLAETIADNKYILGDRLVEIGVSGPTLEATLSAIAMAQQELGHSRLIYRWANDLKGVNGSKIEIKDQTGKAFSRNVEINNWIELIAGLYAVNVATDLVMRAIIESGNTDINHPFSKMLKEQNEHLVYSKVWCKQLLNDKGSIPGHFKISLEKVMIEVVEWLKTIESDHLLLSQNIINKNENLVSKCKEIVNELLNVGAVSNA